MPGFFSKNIFKTSVLKKIAITSVSILIITAVFVNLSGILIRRNMEDEIVSVGNNLLELYVRNLDTRIGALEHYSLTMMVLSDFQEPLKEIASIRGVQSDLHAATTLTMALHNNIINVTEVNSLLISDVNGMVYTGERPRFRHSTIDEIQEEVLNRSGSPVWLNWPSSNNEIALCRAIRTVRNDFQYLDLGIIVLVVDLERLIDSAFLLNSFHASTLTIKDAEGNVVFTNVNSYDMDDEILLYREATDSGWSVYLRISREALFRNINLITTTQHILFLAAFIVAILLSIVSAYKITTPLKRLSFAMHRVSSGDFDFDPDFFLEKVGEDEIGQICNSFYSATQQLKTLINDNYTSQILQKDAQLKALQAQINPHFIYNTLDSINWLAKMSHQDKISTTTQALARLLRGAMDTDNAESTLEKELSLVHDYIQIQQLRFGQRLCYLEHVDQSLLGMSLPKLILQPIIENSIKYCVEVVESPCEITLTAEKMDGYYQITISDNGPGIPTLPQGYLDSPQLPAMNHGIGMTNVEQRLFLLYGCDSGLRIKNMAPHGFSVEIRINNHTNS